MGEIVTRVLEIIVWLLHGFTILVLLWGTTLAAKDFFICRFRSTIDEPRLEQMTRIKNNLGGYVLLGLEILIIADIVDSIAKPTFQDLARLAAIVAIRTVISYFLHKEIKSEDQYYD